MKAYVKPELYFESFELVTHIAGSCQGPVPTPGNQNDWHICLPGSEQDPFSISDGAASAYSIPADTSSCDEKYCYYANFYRNPLS